MQKLILTSALAALIASTATAKGHDQSGNLDNMPGANVGAETVAPAWTLGNALSGGKGKGPGDRPVGPK